ncbi:MAG: hypothetical protein RI942_2490 [Pseudomonadota bacterium]
MQIYPNKLDQHLQKSLLPVYLVSGDEPLQLQECCDAIRRTARARGCEERIVHHADASGFKWDDFSADSNTLSLFASQRLIEVRLGKQKAGKEGSAALAEYCERCEPGGDILLLICDKLDKSTLNSKWVKQIDQVGGLIRIWPIETQQLPNWIDQRLNQAGLKAEAEAIRLLVERIEGNLLAAAQDIEKLKLYAGEQHLITAELVREAVADSARFNAFDLADALLAGQAQQAIRMLRGVRDEGTDASSIHWILRREIRLLTDLHDSMRKGLNPNQAMSQHGVWKNRQTLLGQALGRIPLNRLQRATAQLAEADQAIKGVNDENPWRIFEQIAVNFKSKTST